MNCPKCFQNNEPNAVYCKHCGTKISVPQQAPQYPQYANIVTIGRTNANSICIQSTGVSSNHCKIYTESNNVIIEDLNSTNGTYVNGRRITKAIIQPNDSVNLGQSPLNLGHPMIQNLFANYQSYSSPKGMTNIEGPPMYQSKFKGKAVDQMLQEYKISPSARKGLISPLGAIVVLICFFLPWVKFSCAGVDVTKSGIEIGGIFWVVFTIAIAIIVVFFIFKYLKRTQKSFPYILSGSIISLLIMLYELINFFAKEYETEYGNYKPSNIGLSLQIGFFGTIIGLGIVLWGCFFLKDDPDA